MAKKNIFWVMLPILTVALFLPEDGGKERKATLWRGLTVKEENGCAPYNRNDYRYSPSLEKEIIEKNLKGKKFSPYTDEVFKSSHDSTIDHVVALSEAHDSGLCAADNEVKRQFASDLINLTLASPGVNRTKWNKDTAGWTPDKNGCWFARTVVKVKKAYGLTVDRKEVAALEKILGKCSPKK